MDTPRIGFQKKNDAAESLFLWDEKKLKKTTPGQACKHKNPIL